MTADELHSVITELQRRKRDEGHEPDHILRIADLFNFLSFPRRDIDILLRELLDAGRIEAGQTINDTWIKAK